MARAAGTYTARGIEGVARSIKSIIDEAGGDYSYHAAAGRMMVAADLMWFDDEIAAIAEAYDELRAAEADARARMIAERAAAVTAADLGGKG